MKYEILYDRYIIDTLTRYNDLSADEQCSIRRHIFSLLKPYTAEARKGAKSLQEKNRDAGIDPCNYYDTDVALGTKEIIFLISYPFWARIGGAFDDRFAASGELLEYIKLLKVADLKENRDDTWKAQLTSDTLHDIKAVLQIGAKAEETIRCFLDGDTTINFPVYLQTGDVDAAEVFSIANILEKDFRIRYRSRKVIDVSVYYLATRLIKFSIENDIDACINEYKEFDLLILEDPETVVGNKQIEPVLYQIVKWHLQAGRKVVFISEFAPSELLDIPERFKAIIDAGTYCRLGE